MIDSDTEFIIEFDLNLLQYVDYTNCYQSNCIRPPIDFMMIFFLALNLWSMIFSGLFMKSIISLDMCRKNNRICCYCWFLLSISVKRVITL